MKKGERKTILLANHSQKTLPRVRAKLRRMGWTVVESGNALDTFASLRELKPDVLVIKPSSEPVPEYELAAIGNALGIDQKAILLLDSAPDPESEGPYWAKIDDFFVGRSPKELAARIEVIHSRRSRDDDLLDKIRVLEEQSITDYKTGLFNDRFILRRLVEEFQRVERHGMPLSIIMVDLDDFKELNDKMGHPFADFVLQTFAKYITSIIRRIDVPGRYGGDEFLILLPNTGLDEAARIADRIRSFLEDHSFEKEGQSAKLTISQGINTYSGDESINCDQFLKEVDRAVLEAKKRGKNRVCLHPLLQPEKQR